MSRQEPDTEPSRMDEIVTSVRLPRAQHDLLRRLAESEHRTLSGELRRIVAIHLSAAENPDPIKDAA